MGSVADARSLEDYTVQPAVTAAFDALRARTAQLVPVSIAPHACGHMTATPFVGSLTLLVLPVCAWSQGATVPGAGLPTGNGRDIAAAHCVSCHDASRLVAPGYSAAGWQDVIERMTHVGVVLSPAERPTLIEYLARSFPPQPNPAANIVRGSTRVSFREWPVATPGAFPHDPLATADGAIWYTGQRASVLGRIDPRTGAMQEYPTSVPDSGPHGLAADAQGHIWFTANSAAYIGRLDPGNGEITQYPMPDPRARDPHSLVFDRSGVLWITVQGANRVGRLDPRTGEVRLLEVPTARALPYGIAVSSSGVPYFVEFGSNRIASIDPRTLTIHEHVLPEPGARPRRLAIDSHDVIWYTDYARGFLGRLDPASGAAREWASPGGPGSQPYGITVLADILWYSESGVRPNTLVRFDPKSDAFQSWPIPSGGGTVRNMMATPDGRSLVLAESGAGKLALVDIR